MQTIKDHYFCLIDIYEKKTCAMKGGADGVCEVQHPQFWQARRQNKQGKKIEKR